MMISIYRSIYSCIESYRKHFWGIGKYRIAGYENRYRIVTNHPIYTPNHLAYDNSRVREVLFYFEEDQDFPKIYDDPGSP